MSNVHDIISNNVLHLMRSAFDDVMMGIFITKKTQDRVARSMNIARTGYIAEFHLTNKQVRIWWTQQLSCLIYGLASLIFFEDPASFIKITPSPYNNSFREKHVACNDFAFGSTSFFYFSMVFVWINNIFIHGTSARVILRDCVLGMIFVLLIATYMGFALTFLVYST